MTLSDSCVKEVAIVSTQVGDASKGTKLWVRDEVRAQGRNRRLMTALDVSRSLSRGDRCDRWTEGPASERRG